MSESLHLDDLIGPPVPPEIIRTNRTGHGEMNKHDIFASKEEKQRGVQPGGRRRKKSRKIKRRKRPIGRSGKKNTRKKTATVHKFKIIKRNPLTIKIFEKQGKKWVLKETHVAQKGGTRKKYDTRQSFAAVNFIKIKRLEGMAMHKIKQEWINILRNKNEWKRYIPTPPSNPQEGGRRKTRRRKTRKKRRRKTKRKKTKRRRRKKTRRQIGCNKY